MEKNISSHDATFKSAKTPAQAVQAVKSAGVDTPIILDFDETLFLRNSTSAYLDSVYPRPLGAAFIEAIKAVKPWRWFPQPLKEEATSRDWLLVVATTIVFPWTLLVWRSRAKKLAKTYYNRSLVRAALQTVERNPQAQVVIATLGFDWIVAPLIQYLPAALTQAPNFQMVACRFWQGARDRAKGKLAMVTEAIGASAVAAAVAVTDAVKDAPLLAAVATPCLSIWPDALYTLPMADVYVPLFYSEKVKNPTTSHIIRRVLLGHWSFLVIAFSFLSPHPILNAVSLLLLTISYWCVYEIGYQENDLVGEKYESNPILSKTYARYKSRVNLTNTPAPWYAAIAIALPGLFLLDIGKSELPLFKAMALTSELGPTILFEGFLWLSLLIAVRLTFWVYNQFNEEARIWIYPILQIQTLFGFTLIAGTNIVGSMLLMSLVICRWLHYSIYRCGGDRWSFPINLSCLVLFVIMLFAVAVGHSAPLSLLTWQAAAAFAFCFVRSLKGLSNRKARFRLLAQDNTPEPSVLLVQPDTPILESDVSQQSFSQALHNSSQALHNRGTH
ncbi:MAG: hypothetical protein AAFV90_07635 [Cyanobacteria bacterium J06634_5]